MTEKQITRLADEFADNVNKFAEDESVYYAAKDGFIAGANSRNHEIESLRKQVNEYKRESWCKDEKINSLKKPWISIKEKPKKTDTYFVRTKEGCVDMAFYCKETDEWYDGKITDGTPILYMAIPGI